MDDVLFNSISVISGRWADENERLCAMESGLRFPVDCMQHLYMHVMRIFILKWVLQQMHNKKVNEQF